MTLFSIVIPGYNEAENLKILLPQVSEVFRDVKHEIIIINNASTDNTEEVVTSINKIYPKIREIKEPTLGYGRAILKGLKETKGGVIGIIRADNQEKPEDFLKMYMLYKNGNFDFYKSKRKTRQDDGLIRIIISKGYNFLFKMLFGSKFSDINATPEIFSRECYLTMNLESLDWFVDAEMAIKVSKPEHKFKIGELEIEYRRRKIGKSSVKPEHVLQFFRNMIAWYFKSK